MNDKAKSNNDSGEKKQVDTKEKSSGLVDMLAFIYALIILAMAMTSIKVYVAVLWEKVPDDGSWIFIFLVACFLANIGFKGVKAMLSKSN